MSDLRQCWQFWKKLTKTARLDGDVLMVRRAKTIPASCSITIIAAALVGYAQTPTVTKTLTLFSQPSTVAW
jgi:enolase